VIRDGGGRKDRELPNTGFTRDILCRGRLGTTRKIVLATSADVFVSVVQRAQVMSVEPE